MNAVEDTRRLRAACRVLRAMAEAGHQTVKISDVLSILDPAPADVSTATCENRQG